MAWKIELVPAAERDLNLLDPPVARRILDFLYRRVAPLDDPRSMGRSLHGPRFGEFWKYRVADWRVICKIEDAKVTVLVLRISHRSKVNR